MAPIASPGVRTRFSLASQLLGGGLEPGGLECAAVLVCLATQHVRGAIKWFIC